MKRNLLSFFALAAMLSGCCTDPNATPTTCDEIQKHCDARDKITTPDAAIAALIEGNERYAEDKMLSPRVDSLRRAETLNSQKPFAAIVACSDSRVPVEQLFDQGIGDLFVIRTAGNSVASVVMMGSVDYAIEHLEVPLVVVLGHQNCGGVTSAIATVEGEHAHHPGQIGGLLKVIQNDVEEYIGKPELLEEAIHVNADAQIKRISEVDYIKERIESGKLKVVKAYYNLDSGKVEFAQ